MNMNFLFLACVLAFAFSGCAQQPLKSLDRTSLTGLTTQSELSCRFDKSHGESDSEVSRWDFMRLADRTESRDEKTGQGQLWERDPKGNITMTHLFHREKVALEYSAGELAATGQLENWAKHWSIINPQQLKDGFLLEKRERLGEVDALYYRGANGQVIWLPDLQLPAMIRTDQDNGRTDVLSLRTCAPLARAEVRPTTEAEISRYRRIDFSDLGDMETDPLIRKIESLLGEHDHKSH